MKRALTHEEALDAIIRASSVSILSYQEAIESYLMLRRQEHLFASAIEARSDATGTGAAEGESATGEAGDAQKPSPALKGWRGRKATA